MILKKLVVAQLLRNSSPFMTLEVHYFALKRMSMATIFSNPLAVIILRHLKILCQFKILILVEQLER
jgi:hypothetical protein